ncbi:MAG: adenylate/guanylate cyclase domain-containing protein [Acetobacteraceae bacterium]|nr:adenylate/guanylate cyclase domain-containing protein [Acetobacteraceae bacterium]
MPITVPRTVSRATHTPRRLMVVLYADIVGYSRLVGNDDSGTFLRLRALRRDVIDPALASHQGELRNTAGDSLLATFDSIEQAIDAALAIQAGVAALEAGRADAIRFRIGINLGDAIVDDAEMYGDGINVAARLQAACPADRICVSRAIRDHARQRRDMRFTPLGPLALKNIDRPIEAFLLAPKAHAGVLGRLGVAIPPWRFRKAYAALAAIIPLITVLAIAAFVFTGVDSSRIQREQVAALTASQKAMAEAIARDKGVPLAVIAHVLTRLEESAAAAHADETADVLDVQRRLEVKADEFVALRQQLQQLTGDDPEVKQARAQADAALGSGDLPLAQAKLRHAADLEMAATSGLVERARARAAAAAALLEKSAGVATVTLRYGDAADDLGKAAAIVAPFDRHAQWRLEMQRGAILRQQGDEFGDRGALAASIARYTFALTLISRDADKLDWARNQTGLGQALQALGELDWGSERLEQAVAAFQAAIGEQTREAAPVDLARTQYDLAVALWRLGEREPGTARLDMAADTLQRVLSAESRADRPLDWARAQDVLGSVLRGLGEREQSSTLLQQALAAHTAAKAEYEGCDCSQARAAVQSNIGLDLTALGIRERGTARLEEAVAAYREALTVRTRDRVPRFWARTMNNLGRTLWRIGEREGGTARLEEAVATLRASLEERTRAGNERDRASTQSSLGYVLLTIADRKAGTVQAREAVSALRDAADAKNRQLEPLAWASAQADLGDALVKLGERESGTASLYQGLAAYQNALAERTRDHYPRLWAATNRALGWALMRIGQREPGTEHLEAAVAIERAALEASPRERDLYSWAASQRLVGTTLVRLGEREGDPARLREAVTALRTVLDQWPDGAQTYFGGLVMGDVGTALRLLGEREEDTTLLTQAASEHRSAMALQPREQTPYQWARVTCLLALDLAALGKREAGTVHLGEARDTFDRCLPLLGDDNAEPLRQESEAAAQLVLAELAKRGTSP